MPKQPAAPKPPRTPPAPPPAPAPKLDTPIVHGAGPGDVAAPVSFEVVERTPLQRGTVVCYTGWGPEDKDMHAIVARAYLDEDMTVNLAVLTPWATWLQCCNIKYNADGAPGSWRWPSE